MESLSSLGFWLSRYGPALVIASIILALLLVPIFHFLGSGWNRKRREIMSYFNDNETIAAYFKQFPPGTKITGASARAQLEQVYRARLGLRLYIYPLILIILVVVPLAWLASNNILAALRDAQVARPGEPLLPLPALAAIAGAYLWVTSDLILRDWQRSLLPVDLYQTALRFIIAIPMGYAFAALFKEDNASFISFALGAFPIQPLMTLLQRTVLKRFEQIGVKLDEEITDDAITKLQGINNTIAERFHTEDVYTISQLTTMDPIRLAMRTNLDFNFVIDCASQALAWIYLNEKLNNIRLFGLRGAFEIKTLMDEFDYGEPAPKRTQFKRAEDFGRALITHQRRLADRELSRRNLPLVANALGLPPSLLEQLFWEIAEDPYTVMLQGIWH